MTVFSTTITFWLLIPVSVNALSQPANLMKQNNKEAHFWDAPTKMNDAASEISQEYMQGINLHGQALKEEADPKDQDKEVLQDIKRQNAVLTNADYFLAIAEKKLHQGGAQQNKNRLRDPNAALQNSFVLAPPKSLHQSKNLLQF